jgi:tRNA dimethylallyltransferase
VGPTATGKSKLAMDIAERVGAEILSVDSMQVYRGMDIGTAKPSPEEQRRVRHHMIDIVDPEQVYTVAQFRRAARLALRESSAEKVLVVGGSGLHFRSVIDPMTFRASDPWVREQVASEDLDALVAELLDADPDAGAHVDLANPRRVVRSVETLRISGLTPSALAATEERRRFSAYEPELDFVGVALDRADLDERVGRRLADMRRRGFMEEVERLAPRLGPTASLAVGYQQLLRVVRGEMSVDEGFEAAEHATMRLVKHQRTYFRRDPRLRWFETNSPHLLTEVMGEMHL